MPRQNRVTPDGRIVADPARGTVMGNRGILHDAAGRMGPALFRHRAWIACLLALKGRRHPLDAPNLYTPLFFLDEAVALAAGHRPCAECRRADYNRFRDAWTAGAGPCPRASEIDDVLHRARVLPRRGTKITFGAEIADLPDGTFIALAARPMLLRGDALFAYGLAGYDGPVLRPKTGTVTVLTPEPIVRALKNGYRPAIHPTSG